MPGGVIVWPKHQFSFAKQKPAFCQVNIIVNLGRIRPTVVYVILVYKSQMLKKNFLLIETLSQELQS